MNEEHRCMKGYAVIAVRTAVCVKMEAVYEKMIRNRRKCDKKSTPDKMTEFSSKGFCHFVKLLNNNLI